MESMRRYLLVITLLALSTPAWGGKSITVAQLGDLLHSLDQEKKSDAEIAASLQELELSEQLTRSAMSGFLGLVKGPLSTAEIYVLEARSADLAPPASDLPALPAPDTAAQKTILSRTETYVTRSYDQLPVLAATKTTLRFQDNTSAVASSSGIGSSARDVVTSSGFTTTAAFVHYINATATPVLIERGSEKKPAEKDATRWGANGYIQVQDPAPGLGRVFKEVQAAGSLDWLRWESIDGKQVAVFSFAVPGKKSKMDVDVCCFPAIRQAGIARFYSSSTARAVAGSESSGGAGGVTGNFQTNTDWHDFRATVPYHGKLFIDPNTGTVLRMIVESELKPSDLVHQMDTRVDYGQVKAGQSTFMVPVKAIVNSIVVPNGDSGAGSYSTRCTLFVSEYSDYRLSPGK